MSRLLLLVWCVAFLVGCSKLEVDSVANIDTILKQVTSSGSVPSAQNHELGRKVYNFRCYYCHGYSGDAHTLAATSLDPKPLDFTTTAPSDLSHERMMKSIKFGREGTAMMAFDSVLSADEVAAVAGFVRQEFMIDKAENTRYHTVENGWSNHERYIAAYPFALGEIPLDAEWEELTEIQVIGKKMFLTSCISCHDRAYVLDDSLRLETRTVSYPRNKFSPGDDLLDTNKKSESVDGMASASLYAMHDRIPEIDNLSTMERKGETLFQGNCAFCHAADGTGRNWIGSFLQPHPRNLNDVDAMHGLTREQMKQVIREGLPGTSMSAWKSVLTEVEIDAVIAYVERAFYTFPSELDTSSAAKGKN